MSSWTGWETQLLDAIGAPVTSENIAFLDAWALSEGPADTIGGGENQGGQYNPLATTLKTSGSIGTYNSDGVQDYASAEDGISATAQTLTQGAYAESYSGIVAALKSGNPYTYNGTNGAGSGIASILNGLNIWGSKGFAQTFLAGGAASGATSTSGNANTTAQSQASGALGGIFGGLSGWLNSAMLDFTLVSVGLALLAGGFVWLASSSSTVREVSNNAAKGAVLA